MVESTFLIPMTKNKSGETHSRELWTKLEDELCSTFGGFSRDLSYIYGQWTDDAGEVISDYSQRYTVALDQHRIPELKELLLEFKVLFGQECIYLSILGQVYFI